MNVFSSWPVIKFSLLILVFTLTGCGGSSSDSEPTVQPVGNIGAGGNPVNTSAVFQGQFFQFEYPESWVREDESDGATDLNAPDSEGSSARCSAQSSYLPGETLIDPVGRLTAAYNDDLTVEYTEISGELAAFMSGTIVFIFEFQSRSLLVFEREIETLHFVQCLNASPADSSLIFNSFRLI